MDYSYRDWLFWEPYVVALLSIIVLYMSWFVFDEGSAAISVSLINILSYMDANLYIVKFFSNDIETIGFILKIVVFVITGIEIIFIIVKALKLEKTAKFICFLGGLFNLILSSAILVRYFFLIEFDGFVGMGIYIRLTFMPLLTFMISFWQLTLSIPKPKWA